MTPESSVAPSAHFSGMRILCVDDDRFIREAISFTLNRLGCIVTCAADGRQALQLIQETGGHFDALITDHNMPQLTGLELVRELRVRGELVEIIVLSGNLPRAEACDYLRFGVSKILIKPCMPQTIVSALGEVVASIGRARGLTPLSNRPCGRNRSESGFQAFCW